jgi:glycerophosphoryl diester phosphodiesterase
MPCPAGELAKLPRLIAHGGGQVAGRSVTNSLQALDQASAAGLSVIELDLAWTRDQHSVLIHDWGPTYQRLFSRRSGVPDQVGFNNLMFTRVKSSSSRHDWVFRM